MKKSHWREFAKNHTTAINFEHNNDYANTSENLFRLHIPEFFHQKIDYKNPNDPLLLQVLPHKLEHVIDVNYSNNPVGDLESIKTKGVIHKYFGRVLLIATGTCAINCRYCFRREFPYSQNTAASNNWSQAIEYIQKNKNVHEVILSGGDPLMLSTKVLKSLSDQLQNIPHIKTLRIHTRMPLVVPQRINDNFTNWLNDIKLNKVMVLHCNHANELQRDLKETILAIKNSNTLLLNQSVLLKNINDDKHILVNLSHQLFQFGILPYYLNILDKVNGTKHFFVSNKKAKKLHKQLIKMLPGYLVPKLVADIIGKKNKTPIF